jgi:hypothetical protein
MSYIRQAPDMLEQYKARRPDRQAEAEHEFWQLYSLYEALVFGTLGEPVTQKAEVDLVDIISLVLHEAERRLWGIISKFPTELGIQRFV